MFFFLEKIVLPALTINMPFCALLAHIFTFAFPPSVLSQPFVNRFEPETNWNWARRCSKTFSQLINWLLVLERQNQRPERLRTYMGNIICNRICRKFAIQIWIVSPPPPSFQQRGFERLKGRKIKFKNGSPFFILFFVICFLRQLLITFRTRTTFWFAFQEEREIWLTPRFADECEFVRKW